MCVFGYLKERKSILCKKIGIKLADRGQVINEIEKEYQFEYLEPRGKICSLWDLDYKVLVLHIKFEGTYLVSIWPDKNFFRK